MPFKVIPGTYHVVSFSPDGDSIRFRPANPQQLLELDNVPSNLKLDRPVQLRIEAIDTLETHYSLKSGPTVHQPREHAERARKALTDFLGIRNVVWSPDGKKVVSAENDGAQGYILSRAFEKNGRPVAFVFAGDPSGADGFLDAKQVRASYNYVALAEGFAYPTFYEGLFADLRRALAQAAGEARDAGKGVYAADRTTSGFAVSSMADITDQHVIMPKLFRRLAEYVAGAGSGAGFKAVLEAAREPVLDLRHDANFTHFDSFVQEEEGTIITLLRHPEELVFDPKVPSSTEKIAVMMGTASPSVGEKLEVAVPIVGPEGAATV
jgi:endonuclease YncB( thermonuclease family)